MRTNLQRTLDNRLALKLANKKHNPVLLKLVVETLDFLKKYDDYKVAENFLRDTESRWHKYAEKHQRVRPEAFIESIIKYMV